MVATTYDADPALSPLGLSPSSASNPASKQAVSFTTTALPVTGIILQRRISETQLPLGGGEALLVNER